MNNAQNKMTRGQESKSETTSQQMQTYTIIVRQTMRDTEMKDRLKTNK